MRIEFTDEELLSFYIREKRTKKRLLQKDLAEIVGIGQSTVSKYERGDFRSFDFFLILAMFDAVGGSIPSFKRFSSKNRKIPIAG